MKITKLTPTTLSFADCWNWEKTLWSNCDCDVWQVGNWCCHCWWSWSDDHDVSRDKLPVSSMYWKLPSRLDTSKRVAAATAAGAAGDELGLETVVSRALDGYVFSFFLLCVFLLNSYLSHLDHVHGTRKNEHHKLPRHNEGYHYHNGGPLRTKRGLYDEKKSKKGSRDVVRRLSLRWDRWRDLGPVFNGLCWLWNQLQSVGRRSILRAGRSRKPHWSPYHQMAHWQCLEPTWGTTYTWMISHFSHSIWNIFRDIPLLGLPPCHLHSI